MRTFFKRHTGFLLVNLALAIIMIGAFIPISLNRTFLTIGSAPAVAYADGTSSLLSTKLYFPVYRDLPNEWTGLAIINNSNQSASIMLKAYGTDGALLPLPTNPFAKVLAPHEQLAQLGWQLFGSTAGRDTTGWIQLESDNLEVAACFQYGTNDVRALDGGVAFLSSYNSLFFTRVYQGPSAFFGKDASTTLSLVNTSDTDMAITLKLVANGSTYAVIVTLPPHGMIWKSVSELFGPVQISDGFVYALPTNILASKIVGYVTVQTDDILLGLNAQPPADFTKDSYFPQIAVGGDYFTNIKLVNTGTSAQRATIQAYNEDGSLKASIPVTLDPLSGNESDVGTLLGVSSKDPLVGGSLIVRSGSTDIVSDIIYSDTRNRRFGAALQGQRVLMREGLFTQIANGAGYFTGLALQNAGSTSTRSHVFVYNSDGNLVGTNDVPLGPFARVAKLLTELVPQSTGLVGGYVHVTSDDPIGMEQLLGEEHLESLSLVPLISPTRLLDLSGPQVLAVDVGTDAAHLRRIYQFKYAGDSSKNYLENTWVSTVDPAWSYTAAKYAQPSSKLDIGDLNNDGRPEIVCIDADGTLRIFDFFSTGSPSLVSRLQINDIVGPVIQPYIRDVDNDGKNELILWKTHYSVSVWKWNGSSFAEIWRFGGDGTWEPDVGDIDDDGKNEILIAVHQVGLAAFKTQGDPAQWSYYIIPLPLEVLSSGDRPDTAKIYDLDPVEKNGNEVIIGGNFSRIAILKHTTGQNYQTLFVSEKLPYFTQWVAAGDVDGDGMLEALANTNPGGMFTIFWKLGGVWGELTRFSHDGPSLYATDLNGDGRSEILLGSNLLGFPTVYEINTSGEVIEKWQSPVGFSSSIFAK